MPLVLLAGAIGCDAVLGLEHLPPGKPVPYASAECSRCVVSECAPVSKACLDDHACEPLARCLASCAPDDLACRGKCEASLPLAVTTATFAAYDRCVRGSCTEPCMGVSGIARAFGACDCLEKACKPQTLDCIRSSLADPAARVGECERRARCVAESPIDPRSIVRCQADHPAADTEFRAIKECFAANTCAGCPIAGTNLFECVGKYRWPPPPKPTAEITFRVGKFDTAQTPLEGVAVRVCGADVCEKCDTATPLAQGTTKADGSLLLKVPTGITGFAGCFDFSKEGYAYMSMSPGRPIVGDSTTIMLMLTAETLPLLGTLTGAPIDPAKGSIVAFAIDCFTNFTPGVSLDVVPSDPGTKRGYFRGTAFDDKATETGKLGVAMFLNVPKGYVTMQMSKTGKVLGLANTVVRPGVLNTVLVLPKVQD